MNTTENLKTTKLSNILNMFSTAYKRDCYIDQISTKALDVLSRQTEADPATYNESSENTLNNAQASICKSALEDLKYNEVKNMDQTSLPNEDQNDSEITERIPSLEEIKCSDVNYNTHTQVIHLLESSSHQQKNERSSLNNIYSENMHKNGSYKKNSLVQKTAEIGVRHCSSQEAATKKKNFGEKMFNVTQQIKQEAETEEMIASGMTEDIQCSQIAEANTLMYQQDFSANHSSSSSEAHDHLHHSSDTKEKHIYVDIIMSESKVRNKKFISKSHLRRNIKSLKNLSSPVVYSREVSKVPFVAINNALPNYVELSKQDNVLKSKSLENIPASLGVKKKQNDIKTFKMVAKYVSISGMSPVSSSGIYSTAKICDKKAQTLGSSSLRSTPLILPPMNSSVENTEVTKSITATQSSSLELALSESSITSLSVLSSLPKLNISNTSQSTTTSAVNISAQEVENKGSIHNPENQKVLNEDISSHVFSTNAIASKSSTENNKLSPLLKKTSKQHCGKRKHTKKTKGANKTAVKFEYDESYICDYCGKPEKYMGVLRRHVEVEHGWINERSSLNNIYSENMHKNGSYKKNSLVQKTAEIGVRHCSSQEAATKKKNFGEKMFNVTQQIKQEAETEEMIASGMTEDIQCSQIAEANTLMYQQDFSANHSSSSSETHDHLHHSSDTKEKHIYVDIIMSESKVRNKKFISKSHLRRNIKSLKNLSSPVVYSREVSKVPFVAINNALPNYVELSKQDNVLKSKSLENIPAGLGVKKKQNDIKTFKMVAKYVSISGMSPVSSSGIYSTAKICDKKAQTLGSSSLRSTPLILPPMNSSVENTEVTKSITATQSSSLELALSESSITSLSVLSSLPELNISNTSQSTTTSAVNISAQEVENKGSENQKVLNEDISSHVFSTNAIASKSSTENNKLNPLLDSGAVWTEGVMVRNKRKQQMVKAHSNTNDGNESKCTERLSDHDIRSSVVEIEHKYGKIAKVEQKKRKTTKVEQNSKKTAKASWNIRTSNQQKCRTIKSKDSIFPDDSTNKLDILNKTTNPHLRIDRRMIDNLKPKHIHNESKSKLTEINIIQQDLSGKSVYSDSTSQEIISSPSQIYVESDKRLQEATFMPNEVNNVDSNLYPSVSNFPSTVNDHYLTKDTQRYAPHIGTTSSFDPRYFSAEHDWLRKRCYYSAVRFNYFATNNETLPLQGRVSTSFNGEKHKAQDLCSSTVQQEVPTSQITNPLSNGGINMFLEDQTFGNYNTEFNTDKFIQKTYSNAPENENNWHNVSKECEYMHQQLNKVSENYDSNVSMSLSKNNHSANWQSNNKCQNEIGPNIQNWINSVNIISGKNKHNALRQTNNNCLNEIGPNIQNWVISREEDNLLNSGRNFHDTVTEPHTFMEQVEAMQKDTQNTENKIIVPINKQEKTNKQHCGKRKHTKKTKGANKTAVKFEYDESYLCSYCGKLEKYMAVLRRHVEVEHGWIMPPESADL